MSEPPPDHDLHAFCIGCAYPLLGLEHARCPECGREFDRGVPATYDATPHHRSNRRLLFLIEIVGFVALMFHAWAWASLEELKLNFEASVEFTWDNRRWIALALYLLMIAGPYLSYMGLAWEQRRRRPILVEALAGMILTFALTIASVAVVGLSNQASAVSYYLIACTIGHITVVAVGVMSVTQYWRRRKGRDRPAPIAAR